MDQFSSNQPSDEPQQIIPTSKPSVFKSPKLLLATAGIVVVVISLLCFIVPYLPLGILRFFPIVLLEHGANKEIQRGYPKVQTVYLIGNTQSLGRDLENYYQEKGMYPTDMNSFQAESSGNINRTFIVSMTDTSPYNYIVSSDKHFFVLYALLPISKDKVSKVNGFPINAAEGNILGINCSDPKIFCITNSSH